MLQKIFFAYEGNHPENADAIKAAATNFNRHQKTYKATTWENFANSGTVLNLRVLRSIDECSIFACDLTYLNHNVLFELGYAIGLRKQLIVLLNTNVKGAQHRYQASKLLRNIQYAPFSNGNDILRELRSRQHIQTLDLSSQINIDSSEWNTHDVLYLGSRVKNQASLSIDEAIRKSQYSQISNDSSEVEYQTMVWYMTNIARCSAIVFHMLGQDISGQEDSNGVYSFYAGIGVALGKKVLLLAPEPFMAPIDYSDILVEYSGAPDATVKVESWLIAHVDTTRSVITRPLTDQEREFDLLRLGIGYDVAEEESEQLLEYFVEIETYKHALKRNSCIITGRKGAGKTALYIKLRDYFESSEPTVLNVFLKPESDELLEDIEVSHLFESERARQSLFLATWRFVFFNRLFGQLMNRARLMDPAAINVGSVEARVLQFANEHPEFEEIGHFSALAILFRRWNEQGFGDQQVLQKIYVETIGPIAEIVKEFVRDHKYTKINVVADNLDKTWTRSANLEVQADMILGLLEFNGKIPKELAAGHIKPHTVIVLRTDIFEYVRERSRENDKLELKRMEIDWSQFPIRLRELLEKRFRYSLDEEYIDIGKVWTEYFAFDSQRHPFEVIQEAVVPRPRDIIYFVSKLFESAVNNKRPRVTDIDLQYAVDAYSSFLHQNMIAEAKAEYPEVEAIFAELQSRYYQEWLDLSELEETLQGFGYDSERFERFISFLLSKNYLVVVVHGENRIINDPRIVIGLHRQKRLWFIRRHKLRVQINPTRYNVFRNPSGASVGI